MNFGEQVEARRYSTMRLWGDALKILDERHGRKRDTAVSAWRKCWLHWGSWNASDLSCYFRNTDLAYIGYYEVGFERSAGDILTHIRNIGEEDW